MPEIPFDDDETPFEAPAVTDDLPLVFIGPHYDDPPQEN